MNVQNKQTITIDMRSKSVVPVPYFTQNDTNVLEFIIKNDGANADLSNIERINAVYKRPDGIDISSLLTNVDNIIMYELGAEEMAVPGFGDLELQFYAGEQRLTTLKLKIYFRESLGPHFENGSGYPMLQKLFLEVAEASETVTDAGNFAMEKAAEAEQAKVVALEAADSAKSNPLMPVANFATIATTYPTPATGDETQTLDDGKVYRYLNGSWTYIRELTPGPVAALTQQLAGKADIDPDFATGGYELPGEDTKLYRVKSKGITHTVMEIVSPEPNENNGNEATIALMREVDGESGGPEFMDIYNNGYVDSRQAGIRIQARGSGKLRPFVLDYFDGITRTETFRSTPEGKSYFKGDVYINGKALKAENNEAPFDPANTEGIVLLTGSDFGSWAKRYGDRMEVDTEHMRNARQGVKILMDMGDSNMTAIRNNNLMPIDLSRTETIRVNLFVVNAHNIVDLELYFAETADYTNFISYRIGEGKLSEGWNELIIDTASYIVEGVADLSTAKTSMQIRAIPAETGGCELTFDSMVGYKKGKAKAIFTFDDGWLSQYTKAFPLLQVRGFRGNIGVVPTWIDEIVDPAYEKVMSYNQFAHLYEYGWDLFNHTYSHPNLNNGTAAAAVSQVEQCRDWLNNEGWTRASEILAYPYGGHINIAADLDFRNTLRYARSLVEGIDSNVIPDKMRGKTRNLIDGVTPASVIADINTTIAAGGTIVFTNHLIADTPPADPYGMYYSTANFTQILDYLYTKRDEIEVITLSEWVGYMESVQS
ncbi:polysaccharide deacetylase family protein [Domibacillus mangrovi]|uniref:NodB homology domain-containing protein n=1 Tax=Domibacillus mangrovi TaxID=1714354 RepID=A0A1Q5P452_9BACI|nr:polysaccharide deacetylase family protein [Domibacillus mangrovi]OKL36987.1 hypothetical protein BLL40_05190 [Domibacillus mangrovi]